MRGWAAVVAAVRSPELCFGPLFEKEAPVRSTFPGCCADLHGRCWDDFHDKDLCAAKCIPEIPLQTELTRLFRVPVSGRGIGTLPPVNLCSMDPCAIHKSRSRPASCEIPRCCAEESPPLGPRGCSLNSSSWASLSPLALETYGHVRSAQPADNQRDLKLILYFR